MRGSLVVASLVGLFAVGWYSCAPQRASEVPPPLAQVTEERDEPPAPAEQKPPYPCPDEAVSFCEERVPLDSKSVTCYRGRSGVAGDGPSMDLRPLSCLPDLEALTLVSGELEFIQTLPLTDLSPLAGARSLRRLRLGHTTLRDVGPLGSLIELRELSLHASPVSDISALATLTNLRELDLSGTAVRDLKPLADMAHLERLDLSSTPVHDIQVLADLPRLKRLGLVGNRQLSAAQVAALKALAPDLQIAPGRSY